MLIICSSYWASVLQNALGCTFGSLAAIGSAVWIYRKTNVDHQKDISEQARIEQKDALQYFYEVIDQILKSSYQQNNGIKKFTDDIKAKPLDIPLLQYVPLFDFKRIAESHALDKLFLSYTKQFPSDNVVKNFREIISIVEFLYTQFLEIKPHAKRGLNFDHERKIQVKQLYHKAYSLLGGYMAQIDYDQPDPIESNFMAIVEAQAKNFTETSDVKFYHEYFFFPVHQYLVEIMVNPAFRTPLFIQLAEVTRDGIKTYQSIPKHNENLANEFEDIQKATVMVISQLHSVSGQLMNWGANNNKLR